MKLKQIFLLLAFIVSVQLSAQNRSVVGNWQLIKQGSCLEETASSQNDDLGSLRNELPGHSTATPQVVSFRDNFTGDETTRILNSSKSANLKKFLYKFNGEMLLILDKKSQTISDSYIVDKFTADSLVLSDASRPCETKIFLKISQDRAN
jgi:hypothetical protein